MDIKNALNAVIPLSLRAKEKTERTIRSDSTADRDADGRMASGGEHKQSMSDEQFQKALEHLKAHQVVKEHGLIVETIIQGSKRLVLVKEPNGKIVRRIQEDELMSLSEVKEKEKGQLLRKSA